MTETTDTRSRRYVLQNSTDKLINYELRRKMRRVGVQLQDLGTRLCWQVFIDDAGTYLGLAELVHVGQTLDASALKQPELIPSPQSISLKVPIDIPYSPFLPDAPPNTTDYVWEKSEGGLEIGISTLTQALSSNPEADEVNEKVREKLRIKMKYGFKIEPPQSGYIRVDKIAKLGVHGNKTAEIKSISNNADGSFDIIMEKINFGAEDKVTLDLELHFDPDPSLVQKVDNQNDEILDLLRKSTKVSKFHRCSERESS